MADPGLTAAQDVARTLLSAPVEVSRVASGGRNSRIYRVRCGGRDFALKQYPSRQDDPRDRLGTEVGALRLMADGRVTAVPRVEGVDQRRGSVLLTWIEGAPVETVGDADIDGAAAFLHALHGLRRAPSAAEQPPASEACLSGAEIERQISARFDTLRSLPDEPELALFIETSVLPAFRQLGAAARAGLTSVGLDFAADLPQEWRSLVPADFGFHNALRCHDGSLAFVDFEYFGWDDPVKLTADILLHPGHALAAPQRARLRQAALRVYGGDARFEQRLKSLLPLFGLRWVLILLNEFLPERWQRRVLAGDKENWSDAKKRQLARARNFLAALPQTIEV